MTASPRAERLARVRKEMTDGGVGAVLLRPSADFRYFTGYLPPLLERLTMLVVPAQGDARLVVPALEAPLAHEHLGDLEVEVVPWQETEDPVALVRDALRAAGTATGRLAAGDQLWSTFLLRLQAALPEAELTVASTVTRPLRMVKDPAEVEALARVAAAVDRVVDGLGDLRWAGRREREVARELDAASRAEHDETLFVIVGAGPNSASPHHSPGDRVIRHGDPVVVDIGGRLDGYCSDTTRTLVVGEPPPGFVELCQVHEDPYIVAGNRERLVAGTAFSVEPGIYLPGRFGARIEDIVVCPEPDGSAEPGARRLNQTARRLRVVPG